MPYPRSGSYSTMTTMEMKPIRFFRTKLFSFLCLGSGAGFAYRRRNNPLHVIWSLDSTLIHSTHVQTHSDRRKASTVLEASETEFRHVDDKLNEYKSNIRKDAKLVLQICNLFAKQYVFANSTDGYVRNAISVLDPEGEIIADSLSSSNFSKNYLNSMGKEIELLMGEETLRCVLIDHRLTSFKAQPESGLWIHPWKGDEEDGMWKYLWILLRCNFSSYVPATLEKLKIRDLFKNSKRDFRKKRMDRKELKRVEGHLDHRNKART